MDAVRRAYVTHLAARAVLSEAWLPEGFATAEQLREAELRRAARTRAGRPAWLQEVPDLHGKPSVETVWEHHFEG